MVVDGLGNVIIANTEPSGLGVGVTVALTKLDSTLTPVWSMNLSTVRIFANVINGLFNGLGADSTGNIYLGGQLVTQFVGQAAIQQVLPDGTLGWKSSIGSSAAGVQNSAGALTVGPDDTVYISGSSSGQLPNQPVTASGDGFVAHYAKDGTLISVDQAPFISTVAGPLTVDTAGQVVLANSLVAVDSNLQLLWAVPSSLATQANAAFSPSGLLFDSGLNTAGMNIVEERSSATGAGIWQRQFAVQTGTVNAVEGETWTGQFRGTPVMVATSDSVYLAGSYSNTYKNGSSPPPTTAPCYVARLDTMGSQIWFRQFETTLVTTSGHDFAPSAIALSGKKLVVASSEIVFQLNAADGTGP
jgi:hypothetical protein